MSLPRSDFRQLNGLKHQLLRWEADGPTLVLLHGYLDLSWSFLPFAEALQRRMPVRLVAPDLRGHGATEWVGAGGYYHFPDYVADMHALLAGMPRPLWLLGHSMGGTIAALLAGTFPDLVDRLVLVEGLGPPQHEEEPPDRMAEWISDVEERRKKTTRPMASIDVAQARLAEKNARLSPQLVRLLAEKSTRPVEGGVVWSFDPLHRTRSPLPYQVDQLRTFLRHISQPTLLVDGSESGFAEYIDADGRAREIRHCTRATIRDAGHMVHQDQPEALAEVVSGFLET